jgi:hypothetical protein
VEELDCPIASALNAAKVLFPVLGALIAITIPSWQWPVWLQCIQIGVVSLTIMVNTGILVAGSDTGIYPDLNPVTLDITEFIGSQGELNADWTTEWFLG